MLFQSQPFLLAFLPATLILWYATAAHKALREWALIAMSLVFYAQWDPRFVPLLVGQIAISFIIAVLYLRSGRTASWLPWLGIAANLSVLVFFKYSAFLAENLMLAVGLESPAFSLVLPIGISFYTFEIVSYLADLRWHDAPRYPLRRFALFVLLFPRLIAGPIVRHHEIIPQFDLDPWRAGLFQRLAGGMTLFVIGLAKKVYLADRLAPIADKGFADAASGAPGLAEAWSGTLAFTFQLFLDFSAYSEMAIGIALMLGFTLPQNFEAPYVSLSLREFWRRWHMTLSRYLRDYVFIPLGGSRKGPRRYLAAALATMGLCGLWHGAGWTFVAWGLMHGAGLVANHFWQARNLRLPSPLAWALTFLFVTVGWVLFRAPSFTAAAHMLYGLAGLQGLGGAFAQPLLIAAAAAVSMVGPTSYQVVTNYLRPSPAFAVLTATAMTAVILEVGAGQPLSFIYFQF
jgi:D-alanyl-lipoteichoic acid acyltransferase DltB (MBOAT superfamily)